MTDYNSLTAVFGVGDKLYTDIERDWAQAIVEADRADVIAHPPKLGELSIQFSALNEDPAARTPILANMLATTVEFSGIPERIVSMTPTTTPNIDPFDVPTA